MSMKHLLRAYNFAIFDVLPPKWIVKGKGFSCFWQFSAKKVRQGEGFLLFFTFFQKSKVAYSISQISSTPKFFLTIKVTNNPEMA